MMDQVARHAVMEDVALERVLPDGSSKLEACPQCGCKAFMVRGVNIRASADDKAWEFDAVTKCCAVKVGTLRHELSTIFGAKEDLEMLMFSRARVY